MNAIKSFETHVPTPPGIIRTSISRKHSTLKEIHHALEIHKFASYLFTYLLEDLQNFAWVSINLRCRVNKKANSNLQINCDNHY